MLSAGPNHALNYEYGTFTEMERTVEDRHCRCSFLVGSVKRRTMLQHGLQPYCRGQCHCLHSRFCCAHHCSHLSCFGCCSMYWYHEVIALKSSGRLRSCWQTINGMPRALTTAVLCFGWTHSAGALQSCSAGLTDQSHSMLRVHTKTVARALTRKVGLQC
jgi:hypothetical protein